MAHFIDKRVEVKVRVVETPFLGGAEGDVPPEASILACLCP